MDDVPFRLPHQNGSLCSDAEASSSTSNQSSLLPLPIPAENWRIAERETQRIIWGIQPTKVSEERRKGVMEYVQQLLRYHLGEIFPFGSVPLKTYLPDGDIDLTALGPPYNEETLAGKVRAILEGEEYNMDAKFEVKDIQYIHAEVKLVKCLVQNIVVDISFNQIGGLSTLCFLEKVDKLIAKDHLFKRSIILIKAWCYYESRILGAHHGLLSTYALETLVLYIFHLYNSSLHGPLAVLYRFLDHFSKFDWDNFAISLCGPVRLSSLPEIIVEEPEINGENLLLSGQFLNNCKQQYSVPPRVSESHKSFIRKHLNIVDPLKENNNLGRSVSKGNLYRIRSAFTYGARKLGGILLLSRESIIDELSNFFKNTLERHEDGERRDVQGVDSCFSEHTSSNFAPTDSGFSVGSSIQKNATDNKSDSVSVDDFQSRLCDDINGIDILSSEKCGDEETGPTKTGRESPKAIALSDTRLKRAVDKPTLGMKRDSLALKEPSRQLPTTARENAYYAPHQFFSQENGNAAFPHGVESPVDCCRETSLDNNINSRKEDVASGIPDLADLSGSLENHQKNLMYAQSNAEYYLNGSLPPGNSSFCTQVHGKQHWETVLQYDMPYMNGVLQNPSFSPRSPYQIYPGYFPGSYGIMNMSKPRGTGTFLPNTSHIEYKDRLSSPSGIRKTWNDGPTVIPLESCLADRGDHDQLDHPRMSGSGENDDVKPSSAGAFQSSNPLSKGFPPIDGYMLPSDSRHDFGSFQSNSQVDHSQLETSLDSTVSHDQINGSAACSTVQRSRMRSSPQRMTQTYHLKDEGEFPPLSNRGGANGSTSSDGNISRTIWEAKKE